MIICVSANPAIDCRIRVPRFERGGVHRARSAERLSGGKAAHVAMAAVALGEPVRWIGLLGGTTGVECENGLGSLGISVAAVHTHAVTRTNFELQDDDGVVTEILEPGGPVTDREIEQFVQLCTDAFDEHADRALVALSGSLPPGAPDSLYATLTRAARSRHAAVLVDASGHALLAALAASPDLAKPNHHEVAAIRNSVAGGEVEAAVAAAWLIDQGAMSSAVSVGSRGIVWQRSAADEPVLSRLPAVEARSTVGCGDAALAGFAVAWARGLGPEKALALATACGTANCRAPKPGMIDAREVERLLEQVDMVPMASLTGGEWRHA